MFIWFITVDKLSQIAEQLVRSGVRPSTRRVYDSVQNQYVSFCQSHGLVAVPASEHTILLFVAQLFVKGLKASSVRVYMSSIRSLHVQNGFVEGVTNTDRVKLAIRAIEINQAPPVQKLPITLTILQKVHVIIDHSNYSSILIWCAMCVAHFACLRTGEFVAKSQTDISSCLFRHNVNITNNSVQLHLRNSKTDTSNRGTDIVIGCTNQSICAHCIMHKFCLTRDEYNSHDKPLYIFQNGMVLTRQLFIKQTRLYLSLIGVDPSLYSGHSYRAGGATTAAIAGLHDWEIKRLGRWKSHTYHRYIRPCLTDDKSIAARMFQNQNK